jgi:multicomponent Na+:H+ antiporter subunit C
MDAAWLYGLTGVALFAMGLHGVVAAPRPLRQVLGVNVCASGVFLFLVAMAARPPASPPDPVPQAMVLTGLVVSISATALALTLIGRLAPPGDPPPREDDERR